jgi:hypothetical protein
MFRSLYPVHCLCVNVYYCHRVSTQLHLNIYIISGYVVVPPPSANIPLTNLYINHVMRYVVDYQHVRHSVNHLKPTGYVMHQQCTNSRIVCSAHTVFMCFVIT